MAKQGTETYPLAWGLNAVKGLRVGHAQMRGRATGCTVVLTEDGAVAGVDVRGGAPGSRELALLEPSQTVGHVHGVLLAGGSAFGLDAATGVMRWLEGKGVGYLTANGPVPIVPALVLYDLGVGDRPHVRPDAECGERACAAASGGAVIEGAVGAGAGASVGKLLGPDRAMRGGLGTEALRLRDGTTVAALVAVNALGDVIDPSDGSLVAGARGPDGRPADARRFLLEYDPSSPFAGPGQAVDAGQNTTIGIIATDASLSKTGATRLARMAHDGLARTLYPAHTPFDGDALIALATGDEAKVEDSRTLGLLGAAAAEVLARAVLRAVRESTGLPGLPSVRDLGADSSPET